MSKNLKILIAFIVFGIIVSILLNRCQRKMSDRIREEEQLKTIESKTTNNYDYVESTEETTTRQIVPPKYVEYEGYLISELNKDDFIIDDFDEKEQQIYQSAAVWQRKSDGRLFFRAIEYDEESNSYKNPLDHIGASTDKYEEEMYLENKVWVDKVGIDAVYLGRFEKEQVIYELCKKNCDFDKYMVTDHFKSKYSEKDGILGKVDYDEIEYTKEYKDGGAYDLEYTNIVITKGKIKTEYKIDYMPVLDSSLALDDIDIFSIRDLTNEQGEEIKLRMDENNWLNCIERLAFSDDEEVGKSERFIREHPNFNGIIPNTLDVYPQTISQYKLNFENAECSYLDKKVVLDFYDKRKGRTDKYIIVYSTDNNMYINTYEIIEKEMISEDEYNPKADANIKYGVYSFDCKVRLIENNRDISKLPLTQNFIDNNFEKFDILHKIDMIDFDSPRQNNKIALTLIDSYKNKYCYGLTFKIVDNLIDDVEITPLDIKEFPAGDAAFDLF